MNQPVPEERWSVVEGNITLAPRPGCESSERALSLVQEACELASQHNTRGALTLLEEAAALAHEVGDFEAEGVALFRIGQQNQRLRRPEIASECFARALQATPSTFVRLQVLREQAVLSPTPDEAIALMRESLTLSEGVGSPVCQAVANTNLALLYSRLGEFPSACRCYEQALALDSSPMQRAYAMHGLAHTALKQAAQEGAGALLAAVPVALTRGEQVVADALIVNRQTLIANQLRSMQNWAGLIGDSEQASELRERLRMYLPAEVAARVDSSSCTVCYRAWDTSSLRVITPCYHCLCPDCVVSITQRDSSRCPTCRLPVQEFTLWRVMAAPETGTPAE